MVMMNSTLETIRERLSRLGLLNARYGWVLVLGVLVLAIGVIYLTSPAARVRLPEPLQQEVRVILAEPAEQGLVVASQGLVRARDTVVLTMETAGRVLTVAEAFRTGGWVEEGDVLLALDPEPLQLEVTRHRHELASAQLHLQQVRASAQVARRNASPNATPFARQVPQLQEAEARVALAEAALAVAQRRLEASELRAPFTGRLSQVQVARGQQLLAGEALARLYSAGEMEVPLPVRDEVLQLLTDPTEDYRTPLAIPVRLTGRFGGVLHQWDGVISRREGGLSRNQMTTLIADVTLAPGQPPLEPGVFVEAAIQGRPLQGIVALPRSALINERELWVVADDVLRRRPVEWVYRDQHTLYVRAGVSAGQWVVAQGHEFLLEGGMVTGLRAAQPQDAANLATLVITRTDTEGKTL